MTIKKTKSGNFRKKRADTKVKTIEKKYGKDLGVRGDMKLGNFLKKNNYDSLNQLLKNKSGNAKSKRRKT